MTRRTHVARKLICIIGWVLLTGGLLAEITVFIYHRATFTVFGETVKQYAGRTLSEGDARTLWVASVVSLTYARSSLYAVLAASFGGILLFFSRSKPEKENNTESI